MDARCLILTALASAYLGGVSVPAYSAGIAEDCHRMGVMHINGEVFDCTPRTKPSKTAAKPMT